MNELNLAVLASFTAFIFWEMVCLAQLKITRKRDRKLYGP